MLQAVLSDSIRDGFDPTSLTFVDENLQGSQSDLLYQVEHNATDPLLGNVKKWEVCIQN